MVRRFRLTGERTANETHDSCYPCLSEKLTVQLIDLTIADVLGSNAIV